MHIASKLHIYSMGVVAENKLLNSNKILATPTEHITDLDGDIGEVVEQQEEIDNGLGDITKVKVNKTVNLEAEWLPWGAGNRVTSPNVRKGERVIILRYADSDKFYWISGATELDLRRKEIVTYVFGNTDVEGEELTSDNSYWFTVDTINKHIMLHTSANDEEITSYDFKIDAKNGIVSFKDGKENSIELNSVDDILSFNINEKVATVTKAQETTAELSITETTADKILDASTSITETTPEKTINADKLAAMVKSFSVTNDTGEIIAILVKLIENMIAEMHIGNLGVPTALDPGTIAKYTASKTDLSSFLANG